MKSGSINLSKLSSKDLGGRFEGDGVCSTRTTKVEKQDMVGESMKCPFEVLIVAAQEMMQVDDIHLLLCNLVTRAQEKVSHFEVKKTKLDEKLIGFLFNMDDHMNVMIMAQDCMAPIEFDIKALEHNM